MKQTKTKQQKTQHEKDNNIQNTWKGNNENRQKRKEQTHRTTTKQE